MIVKCLFHQLHLSHTSGVFSLPLESLREPPLFLRVREVKEWYVEYLTEMLTREEGDHEDLTAPY